MTRIAPILAILILTGCSNDFDTTCSYFVELSKNPSLDSLTPFEKDSFITERVNRLSDGNAKAAWTAVRNATPEERYAFFKQSAEETDGGLGWTCPAMEALASSIDLKAIGTYNTAEEAARAATAAGLDVTTQAGGDFTPKKSTPPLM